MEKFQIYLFCCYVLALMASKLNITFWTAAYSKSKNSNILVALYVITKSSSDSSCKKKRKCKLTFLVRFAYGLGGTNEDLEPISSNVREKISHKYFVLKILSSKADFLLVFFFKIKQG